MKTEILKLVEDSVYKRELRVNSTESFMFKERMSAKKIIFAVTLISEFALCMKLPDKQ